MEEGGGRSGREGGQRGEEKPHDQILGIGRRRIAIVAPTLAGGACGSGGGRWCCQLAGAHRQLAVVFKHSADKRAYGRNSSHIVNMLLERCVRSKLLLYGIIDRLEFFFSHLWLNDSGAGENPSERSGLGMLNFLHKHQRGFGYCRWTSKAVAARQTHTQRL